MPAAANLIAATVKYESDRIFDTERGARRKLVFDVGGEVVTIWGDAADPAFTSLRKKQQVSLLETGTNQKGEPLYKIVLPQPDPAAVAPNCQPLPPGTELPRQHQQGVNEAPPPAPAPSRTWTDEEKRQIAEDVTQKAKLLAYCHTQLTMQLPGVTEEVMQKYVTTLFLSVTK